MDTPTPIPHLQNPATIRIQQVNHPKTSRRSESESRTHPLQPTDTTGLAGGIFNTRALSRSATHNSRAASDRHTEAAHDGEEGDDWRDGEKPKAKQIYRGTTLLWLSYQSIGAIYGDIGTSPLYVFSSTFSSAPSQESVVQVLSLILWSLTIMVTLKYVLIILRADNEGEGGTFSCYSLLTRYANITERDPREQQLVHMERHLTGNLRPANRGIRHALESNKFFRILLQTIGVLAVSMVLSDGVLTPAQSVLGAVQGLNVVRPDISSSTVVGTSCGIIVLLFLIQPLGLSRLASCFAPIVIVWLGLNGGFGIYNLVRFDHAVLKAFNPYYAFQFFIQNKTEGWKMLGGILLAFTGVEALFADLGAFSMRAIQLSWLCYTYPCLLLAYIGQAAYISVNPEAYSNPFYNSVPPGMLYPSLIIAVLAAIVASQAMITATFQLISQIMKLSYCPQVKVVHTSKTFHGQLYVPFLNWLLMCGAVLVTAVYSNTTRLGNAYGVCVMFVTFFDTCMVTLVALVVWRIRPYLVALPWLAFVCFDGLYLSSALNKVPDGAWFTLTLSGILTCFFLLWRFGKESQWSAEAEDRFRLDSLVTRDKDTDTDGGAGAGGELRLTARWGGDRLSRVRGLGIFFDKTGAMTPAVFTHFASKLCATTDVSVFFHLHPVEAPTVPDGERYSVSRFRTIPGCYRLVVRHGFMDEVISPDLAALVYEKVRAFVVRQAGVAGREPGPGLGPGREEEGYDASDGASSSRATRRSGIENVEGVGITLSEGGCAVGSTGVNVNVNEAAGGGGGARERNVSEKGPVELAALRDEAVAAELARLDRAYAAKIMYVVGKEQMKIRDQTPVFRKVVLGTFLWVRENTRAKIANLRLAMERVVEVGFVKEI